LIEDFIGDETVFVAYALALAATITAAIFSRDRMLRFAITVIVISWFITRFWRMTGWSMGLGNLILDVALICTFYLAWKNAKKSVRTTRDGRRYLHQPHNRVFARHLFFIHWLFIGLHFLVELKWINLSGVYFGMERDEEYGYAFWRNRIFDLTWLYVFIISMLRIISRRSMRFQKRILESVRRKYNPDKKNRDAASAQPVEN